MPYDTLNGPRSDVNDVITFTHDARGQLTQIDYPNGKSQTFNSFTASGLAQTVVDTNGVSITLTYDLQPRTQPKHRRCHHQFYLHAGRQAGVGHVPPGHHPPRSYNALGNTRSWWIMVDQFIDSRENSRG